MKGQGIAKKMRTNAIVNHKAIVLNLPALVSLRLLLTEPMVITTIAATIINACETAKYLISLIAMDPFGSAMNAATSGLKK